jgi:uncharacterized membrane protein YuzA (DUF378 family)
MKNFNALDWGALAILVVGGINWGVIGAFNLDLVSYLLGDMTILTRVVYGLVGLSAIYITFRTAMYTADVPNNNVNRIAHS